jgi:hypothetical protein
VVSLRHRDAAQPSHRDGDPQRQVDPLFPPEQGAKAFAVLVGDLQLDRVQVELGPDSDMGGLYVGNGGIAGQIPSARLESSIAIAHSRVRDGQGRGRGCNHGHVPLRNCAGLIDDAPEPARPSNQFLGEKGRLRGQGEGVIELFEIPVGSERRGADGHGPLQFAGGRERETTSESCPRNHNNAATSTGRRRSPVQIRRTLHQLPSRPCAPSGCAGRRRHVARRHPSGPSLDFFTRASSTTITRGKITNRSG